MNKNEQGHSIDNKHGSQPHRYRRLMLPSVESHLIFWPVLAAGLVLDLWSKAAIFAWLQNRGQDNFPIIANWLHLQMAENPGAAFGLAAGQQQLLITFSIIALVVVLAVFLFAGTNRKIVDFALGLFAAGVCGNLYDRVLNNGMVRDFIDVVYWPGKHWPAFNVADSMLCIAVGVLILSNLTHHQASRKPPQTQK